MANKGLQESHTKNVIILVVIVTGKGAIPDIYIYIYIHIPGSDEVNLHTVLFLRLFWSWERVNV